MLLVSIRAYSMWSLVDDLIGLANSEHSHPSGLLLKTRIFLQYMPNSERLASGECVCVCVCVCGIC